jgi:hypothetical protein
MQKITNAGELKDAILLLEDRKLAEQELLRDAFDIARERLKPANMVKNTFNQVFTGPNFIRTILIATTGVTAGFITKRYFQGLTGRLLKRFLGRIV